jgi:hypothetical protein
MIASQIKIISFLIFLLLSGCFFKQSLKEPLLNGPGSVIKYEDSYFALFPKTYHLFGTCNGKNLDSFNQVDLNKNLILNNENLFRESYYNFLVGPAENIHPDSVGYITEYPGEYMLVKQVTRQEMICALKSDFRKSIDWDRQYLGFINSNKDTVLVINLVDPEEFSRINLGKEWIWAFDGALEHLTTITFNLSDYSITSDFCSSIK